MLLHTKTHEYSEAVTSKPNLVQKILASLSPNKQEAVTLGSLRKSFLFKTAVVTASVGLTFGVLGYATNTLTNKKEVVLTEDPRKQPQNLLEGMGKIMQDGGEMMFPIFATLVISLAIFITRVTRLIDLKERDTELIRETLLKHISAHEIDQAIKFCKSSNTALALVLRKGLERFSVDEQSNIYATDSLENIREHMLKVYRDKVELPNLLTIRGIEYLNTAAPTLGIIGTLLGIMSVFGGSGTDQEKLLGMSIAAYTSIFGYTAHLLGLGEFMINASQLELISSEVELGIDEFIYDIKNNLQDPTDHVVR